MKKVIIKIEDVELARALASALCRELPEAEIALASCCGIGPLGCEEPESNADDCLVLDAERLGEGFDYLPVSRFAAMLRAELADEAGAGTAPAVQPRGLEPEDCIFTGFTSGCGGCGLTASAVVYGRILSRLYGRRTLYLSLERMAAAWPQPAAPEGAADARRLVLRAVSGRLGRALIESCLLSDEYGLRYFYSTSSLNPFCLYDESGLKDLLSALATEGGFERVVLDIPADHPLLFEIMAVCERRVVVFGPDETRRTASERLLPLIPGSEGLCHEWDPDSFSPAGPDIHGQFGAEVRALAQKLEGF